MKLKDLMEYKGATPEEMKQAVEFYKEYYGISLKTAGENKYINDPKEIKEAHRRYNQLKRDTFDVSQRTGDLISTEDATKEFMEDASDAWEWMDEYREHGFEEALQFIIWQAERDVENKLKCTETALAQLIAKWESLRKTHEKDKRENRKWKQKNRK